MKFLLIVMICANGGSCFPVSYSIYDTKKECNDRGYEKQSFRNKVEYACVEYDPKKESLWKR